MLSGALAIFDKRERMTLVAGVLKEEAKSDKHETNGIGRAKGRRHYLR